MQSSSIAVSLLAGIAAWFVCSGPVAADTPGTGTIVLQTTPPKSSDPNETAEAAKINYEKRRICQPQEVLGSRIPKMVCATQSQIDARHKADQAWKNELDLQKVRLPPPGGGVVGG